MTAIRPDRLGAVPEKPGPELYAPNRKSPDKLSDAVVGGSAADPGMGLYVLAKRIKLESSGDRPHARSEPVPVCLSAV
jgi:hypothetical protein